MEPIRRSAYGLGRAPPRTKYPVRRPLFLLRRTWRKERKDTLLFSAHGSRVTKCEATPKIFYTGGALWIFLPVSRKASLIPSALRLMASQRLCWLRKSPNQLLL